MSQDFTPQSSKISCDGEIYPFDSSVAEAGSTLLPEPGCIAGSSQSVVSLDSNLSSIRSSSAKQEGNKEQTLKTQDKMSVGFVQFFATLVFTVGVSIGIGGAYINSTEVVSTFENGQEVKREERVIPGNILIQKTGFGMAGLAVGSVFFNYAPGFVQGAVQILGGALTGAVSAAAKQNNQAEEKE
jgi:hypothetical protein